MSSTGAGSPGNNTNPYGFINPSQGKKRIQKMKWDAAADRKLLLFAMGRKMGKGEYEIIAKTFDEDPTPKAVQERYAKLRLEQRQELEKNKINEATGAEEFPIIVDKEGEGEDEEPVAERTPSKRDKRPVQPESSSDEEHGDESLTEAEREVVQILVKGMAKERAAKADSEGANNGGATPSSARTPKPKTSSEKAPPSKKRKTGHGDSEMENADIAPYLEDGKIRKAMAKLSKQVRISQEKRQKDGEGEGDEEEDVEIEDAE